MFPSLGVFGLNKQFVFIFIIYLELGTFAEHKLIVYPDQYTIMCK